jgi:hypothetical protein
MDACRQNYGAPAANQAGSRRSGIHSSESEYAVRELLRLDWNHRYGSGGGSDFIAGND